MLGRQELRRAAGLLSLCLLSLCRLRAAASAPLSRAGEEEGGPPRAPPSAALGGSEAAAPDDLFPDVDPEALAALLLQALRAGGKSEPGEPRPESPDSQADEEGVRSETRSSDLPSEREPAWEAPQEAGQSPEERPAAGGRDSGRPAEAERLTALLRELQRYGPAEPAAKRESPPAPESEEREEREAYRPLGPSAAAKRRAPPIPPAGPPAPAPGESWAGARKLRQQQHLEHQLLQRRYEELAESRRQAEEARRAAAEEERLADMASDLLLQYLLKDGEEEEEEEEEGGEDGARRRGGPLLFADDDDDGAAAAGNVAEDKRSNEAAEDEIDPNTIDRLIELSSKLHLPADDVVDLISDVEERKREKEAPEPRAKPRGKPRKAPPPPPPRKPYRPKPDEAAWNEILKEDEYPAPKWPPRAQGGTGSGGARRISNAISPWTFRPAAYPRYRPLPGPLVPREEAGDEDERRDRDEELENYLDSVLGKHPKMFQ